MYILYVIFVLEITDTSGEKEILQKHNNVHVILQTSWSIMTLFRKNWTIISQKGVLFNNDPHHHLMEGKRKVDTYK